MTQIKISASRPEVEEEIIVKEDTGLKGKLKTLWAQYGYVAVGTYLTIYITTLGSIFISIDNDLFNSAAIGIDPQAAVKKVHSYSVFLSYHFLEATSTTQFK